MDRVEFIQINHLPKGEERLVRYLNRLDKIFQPPLSTYVDIAAYAKKLDNNAYVCALEVEDSFAGLFAVYLNDLDTRIAYLSSFAVMPEYEGQGYSRRLMDRVIAVALGAGMKALHLEVKSLNERAIKFYEKCGFTKSEEKTDDSASFYMHKSLTD